MHKEIERKFLVDNINILLSVPHRSVVINQYYIDDNTRIRLLSHSDDRVRAYITMKHGKEAIVRDEWEFEVDISTATYYVDFLKHNNLGLGCIHKTRHIIPDGYGTSWEIDVFHEDNDGLIIAEIEMLDEKFEPHLIDGIGKEVTGNSRYYNANLARHPFAKWGDNESN